MTKPIAPSPASTPTPLASETGSRFSLAIHLYKNYQQIVDFRMPGVAVLGLDECPPLGRSWGPSPAHLLGSALGACLGGALLRILRDAGAEVVDLRTDVRGTIQNDRMGRPHVASITVRLIPVVTSRSALEAVPSPEYLARMSMVADSLRSDLALWVAITPEVRDTTRVPRHDSAYAPPARVEKASPVPHFVEAGAP